VATESINTQNGFEIKRELPSCSIHKPCLQLWALKVRALIYSLQFSRTGGDEVLWATALCALVSSHLAIWSVVVSSSGNLFEVKSGPKSLFWTIFHQLSV